MKTKFFTVLAVAALLLGGEPAYAHGGKGGRHGGGGHAVAFHGGGKARSFAVHRGNSARSFAVHRGNAGHSFAANRGRNLTAGRSFRSRPSVALTGHTFNYGGRNYTYENRGYNNSRGRYRGHGGSDWGYPYLGYSYPDYGYDTYGPSTYAYEGASVSMQVQQDLAQQGYYQGPVDGVVGPGTRAAIAAYQRDNGLPVTGAIDTGLLQSLGI